MKWAYWAVETKITTSTGNSKLTDQWINHLILFQYKTLLISLLIRYISTTWPAFPGISCWWIMTILDEIMTTEPGLKTYIINRLCQEKIFKMEYARKCQRHHWTWHPKPKESHSTHYEFTIRSGILKVFLQDTFCCI